MAWSLLACAGAFADHNTTGLISTGPTGGNGTPASVYRGAATDGSRVFFQTSEKLVAADTDNSMDVYERETATGVTNQVSVGVTGGNGAFSATFAGVSANGLRVIFRTLEPLVAGDTDAAVDLYERAAGVTTLMSTGPDGGNGDFNAVFDGLSSDGLTLVFDTDEGLVSADTDEANDIYQRVGGTTTRLSTGPADAQAGLPAMFAGMSRDGSHTFFHTDEPLVSSDTDTSQDVYQSAGGVTTHVSIGPAGGNGDEDFDYDAAFDGTNTNGTKVWIHTDETLTADDTDFANDVYERVGGTITRLTTGPAGGNAEITAFFTGASDDGSRVFFDTSESLTAGDTDASTDIYERAGGTTTLISVGPNGGNGAFFASFQRASADGARVVFQTPESLVAEDTDTQTDVYLRAGGATTLISTGPQGGNAALPAMFRGASKDTQRIFFDTSENLVPAATGTYPDLYERANGGTTFISTGPTGGSGNFFAFFEGASDDGTKVYFTTAEALVSTDTDSAQDVYMASSALGYVRPKGATPIRVPLVPAFVSCTSPNRTHGPALAYPSCNPPAQVSPYVTIGTPDSNGKLLNGVGSVKLQVLPGNASTPADEADVSFIISMTDVRRRSDLADYTGQLQLDMTLRMTDKVNGSTPNDLATGSDIQFPATVPCTATSDPNIGSTCAVSTSADSVVPGSVPEIKRTIWDVGRIALLDGGADDLASTTPNSVFVTQGVMVP